jgi:hypothetical protein
MENTEALKKVLTDYAVPDPKIVGKLPKGGIQLDFVGHADITRILIEIDPNWRWVPCGWDNGRPAIHVENGMATMWGELQLLGQGRLGVGSVRADKPDLDKELVSDFLRNAAMRFGICLSLWTKQEWDDLGNTPAPAPRKGQTKAAETIQRVAQKAAVKESGGKLSQEQIDQFLAACETKGVDPVKVSENAGIHLEEATEADLARLRSAFKELVSFKEGN